MIQNETIEPRDDIDHKIRTVERIRLWILSLPLIEAGEFEQLDLRAKIIHEVANNATPDEFLGIEKNESGFIVVKYETASGLVFSRTATGWHRWRAKTNDEVAAEMVALAEELDDPAAPEMRQLLAADPHVFSKGYVAELPTSVSTWKKV